MAKLIQLIETFEHRGVGTKDDPCRTVRQCWSVDGQLEMEYDAYLQGELLKCAARDTGPKDLKSFAGEPRRLSGDAHE